MSSRETRTTMVAAVAAIVASLLSASISGAVALIVQSQNSRLTTELQAEEQRADAAERAAEAPIVAVRVGPIDDPVNAQLLDIKVSNHGASTARGCSIVDDSVRPEPEYEVVEPIAGGDDLGDFDLEPGAEVQGQLRLVSPDGDVVTIKVECITPGTTTLDEAILLE